MNSNKLKHAFEYILIFSILIFAIFLLEFFKERSTRQIIITSLSFLYLAVGVWHHWEEKNLTASQILEHAALGAIMFIILSAIYT